MLLLIDTDLSVKLFKGKAFVICESVAQRDLALSYQLLQCLPKSYQAACY